MLPLKSKFSGKFQRFGATNESIQMKISIKMRNFKTF